MVRCHYVIQRHRNRLPKTDCGLQSKLMWAGQEPYMPKRERVCVTTTTTTTTNAAAATD